MNRRRLALLVVAFMVAGAALAQPQPVQRIRGTVQAIDGMTLVVAERSGATVRVALAEGTGVSEVLPIGTDAIKPGTYIGTAALKGADGVLRALEVLVFPDAMRGTAEGHGPWDLQPGSTMTNATIAQVMSVPDGRSIVLRYKDGEQTVVVPDGVPIVTYRNADRSLIVPGAKIVMFAQVRDGTLTALRVLAGKDGLQPPM
ncbi:MAG TPA: hypothetical protein VMU47_15815 [Caldimonas sp.]|nr:hypothetical protein [Caldimonas sp.]